MGTSGDSSLAPLEPHANLAGIVSRLDVYDARSTAHGAILRVRLMPTAAAVDE
jgi:hypothetical protein